MLLLTTGHAVDASDEQPAKLYEIEHDNWYGTCSKKRCPNPFDDLMFEDNDQIQFHGGSFGEFINHKDKWGETPLHDAILDANIKRVEKLIELGANVNLQNDSDTTPLYIAIYCKNEQIVRLLFAAGANINSQNQSGSTLLHNAIYNEKEQIVRLLLANGADVNSKNQSGNTPLHVAAYKSNYEIIQLLLTYGADVNKQNKYGETAKRLTTNQTILAIFNEAAVTPDNLINNSCSIS